MNYSLVGRHFVGRTALILGSTLALFLFFAYSTTALAAAPDGAGPWADTVVDANQALKKNGGPVNGDRSDTSQALGEAETSGTPFDSPVVAGTFYSLGFGGDITLGFDNAIVDGAGDDFQIYEVTGGSSYPEELVDIEVSDDGIDWWLAAEDVSRDAIIDLEGTPFSCIHYVRVTDVSDPDIFEPEADAYDVDAARALNSDEGQCEDTDASIDVEKSASESEIAPGEEVTYTYVVTNDGDFDLDNVVISDDTCSPISGPAVDAGDDGILSVGEAWEFECTMALEETTTNVVTATGTDPFDNDVSDSDEETVAVSAPGCTLTQGYWKNHSSASKHEDPTWNGQEDTAINGIVGWLGILKTPGKGGDAWYILAHQWIAATLNIQAGADDTDVATEMTDAENMLNSYLPGVLVGKAKGATKTARGVAIDLAGVLGSFNEGLIGPGHCDDEENEEGGDV